ncbi:MAG: chaperone modulator CbpM [Methylotenera sp.]
MMTLNQTELIWLDEHHEVTLQELIALSGLSQAELVLLVENGALVPNNANTSDLRLDAWQFSSQCLVSIRTLSRLKHDFELEPNALSLTLVFLERIRTLEFQLHHLEHTKT